MFEVLRNKKTLTAVVLAALLTAHMPTANGGGRPGNWLALPGQQTKRISPSQLRRIAPAIARQKPTPAPAISPGAMPPSTVAPSIGATPDLAGGSRASSRGLGAGLDRPDRGPADWQPSAADARRAIPSTANGMPGNNQIEAQWLPELYTDVPQAQPRFQIPMLPTTQGTSSAGGTGGTGAGLVPNLAPPPMSAASGTPPRTPYGLVPPGGPQPTPQTGIQSMGTTLVLPEGSNKKIKAINFIDQEIRDIIRSLADLAEINLMLANDIQGRVTIMFHDVTIADAMNTMMRSSSPPLVFSWDENILRIYKSDTAPLAQPTLFTLQYANAAEVKPMVDKMLTPRGSCEIDARNNALIIKDTPDTIATIRQVMPELDRSSSSVETTAKPVTEVFYLDYVDATSLQAPIQMVAPNARVQAYSSTSASMAGASGGGGGGRQDMMIITDTQTNLDRIREIVEKLDLAPQQVIIDAHIFEIDLNEEERLGINWQKQIPMPGGDGTNIFDMSIAPETADAGGTGVFRFGTLSVNQFRALLAMLKTKSFAKVLSNPVITTLNNRSANITVGQQIPYVSGSTTDVNGQVTNSVAQANANISLNVTPSVTGNDEVFLNISPSISSVLGFTSLGGNQTPNISSRNAQTQVIVKNNHTIVIGGMIKTDKSETISKVPYLGDLPGLGRLFQNKTWRETRRELVIFITPHIVTASANHRPNPATMVGGNQPRLSLRP